MSLQLAAQFEENEQYEQAYVEYKKVYEQNPNDIGLLERMGHLSLILERPDEAAGYYYEILKRDVTNLLAYEQLMSIYENRDLYKFYVYRGNKNSIEGKLVFAINDFKKALTYADEDETQLVMTRLTLANLYRQTGNNMKAIDEYNLILEYENLHEEIFLQLADIYVRDEAYDSALDVLQRALNKGFETDRIYEALATVYLKAGQPEKSLEYTKNELLKIQGLLELGKIEEAYSNLNNLPDEYKNTSRYYTLQAQYYYSAKDFDKALEFINEYDKLEPNSALTYQMRALVYEENDDAYKAHVNWGKYNILRGNKDIAINELINAIQMNDTEVDVMFTLADLLTEAGDTNHAAEYYEKIHKVEPNNREALRKLAMFREGIGDYKTQAIYLEEILENSPKDLDAIRDLARACERNNDNTRAIELYNKFLELVKDPSEYKKAKDRLDKLENTSANSESGLLDKIMGMFNKD